MKSAPSPITQITQVPLRSRDMMFARNDFTGKNIGRVGARRVILKLV
jgi:hypothetical protein